MLRSRLKLSQDSSPLNLPCSRYLPLSIIIAPLLKVWQKALKPISLPSVKCPISMTSVHQWCRTPVPEHIVNWCTQLRNPVLTNAAWQNNKEYLPPTAPSSLWQASCCSMSMHPLLQASFIRWLLYLQWLATSHWMMLEHCWSPSRKNTPTASTIPTSAAQWVPKPEDVKVIHFEPTVSAIQLPFSKLMAPYSSLLESAGPVLTKAEEDLYWHERNGSPA